MRPNAAEYEDFRVFLRDMVAHLKEMDRSFSYREFSRRAGYSSSSALKLVIDGQRNIAQDSIGRFAEGLGLNRREREAFEALVLFGQAKTNAERNHYYLALRQIAQDARGVPSAMSPSQYDVYTLWCAIPIRELMLVPGFRAEPAWIAEQFEPPLAVDEVERALKILLDVGLAAREGENLVPCEPTISATPSAPSPSFSLGVQNFHRTMLARAIDALDLPQDERNITSVTVSLTPRQYEAACEDLARLRRRLLGMAETSPEGETQSVYHVGLQLVPLTKRSESP